MREILNHSLLVKIFYKIFSDIKEQILEVDQEQWPS